MSPTGALMVVLGVFIIARLVTKDSHNETLAGRLVGGQPKYKAITVASTSTASNSTGAGSATGVMVPRSLSNAPNAVKRMYRAAMDLKGKPYVLGGGHSGTNWLKQAAYDCSGFVSAVLGYGGIIASPQTTQTLPDQPDLENGMGRWVTIYDRTDGPVSQEHTIIDIAGHWFESGGDTKFNRSGNDGVSPIAQPPSSYLDTFNRILHPRGL